MRQALVILGLVLTAGTTALAGEVTTPILFNCNMSFKIEGHSAYLGIGGTSASGKGRLSCYDYVTGAVEDIPLNVSIKGVGLGLGITGFNISGGKVGIGLNSRPEALLGSYARVSANAAIGVGGEIGGGLRLSFSKGSLELSAILAGRSGLGAGVEVSELYIERDETEQVTVTQSESKKVEANAIRLPLPAMSEEVQFNDSLNSQTKVAKNIPTENIVIQTQGSEVILVNSKGQPVKKLKIYLLQK